MEKEELIEKLRNLKTGDLITVKGRRYRIDCVAEYKEGRLKLVYHLFQDGMGLEFALEIKANEIILWREIDYSRDIDPFGAARNPPFVIGYRGIEGHSGEKFVESEIGSAEAIFRTRGGVEKVDLLYWIFKASSGRCITIENRKGEYRAYFSEGELSRTEIEIPPADF